MNELDKDLTKCNFIGEVVDNNDPDCEGKCKVKVYGLLEDLEDEYLPWFYPQSSTTFSSSSGGGALSVPKIGTYVRVRFANGDIYSGEYTSIQNVDPSLSQDIKDDYVGTHVICYDSDEELMVMFQPHKGLTLSYKEAKINIAPTNVITINEPNNNSIITLNNDTCNITTKNQVNVTALKSANVTSDVVNINGTSVNVGKGASVPAVNGTALLTVLTELAQAIQMKMPISPGMPDPSPFSAILSSSVKISV